MQLTSSEALAHRVIENLKRNGHQALLVGGCVRDLLLGKIPKDWDVATDATPERIASLFPSSNLVGAQFGVVLVRDGDETVEVATFRSDGEYRDGRRPEQVRYETDPREDAIRRDFTINALFLDVTTGEVVDYVGGRADLDAGTVRAIGVPEERFQEDRLRLLRAVRFAARLGFRIEDETWEAMKRMAPEVRSVAMERVRDELTRILTEGGARRGFELLDASGLLDELLPEVAALRGVQQPPQYHPEGDVWVHTLLVLEKLDCPTPTLAWAALLHDVGKPPTFRVADRIRFDGHAEVGVEMARRILGRLRFPKEQSERIERLIGDHMKFKDVRSMRESTLKRFVRQTGFEEHLELHRADSLSGSGNLDAYGFVKERLAELPLEMLKPEAFVNGRDLIELGYRPGPRFSEILAAVEDAQLEGLLTSKEEALRFVKERFPLGKLCHNRFMIARRFAILALVLLPCGLHAGKDKSTATPGLVGNEKVAVSATAYLDSAAIKQLVGSDLGGYYTVLQVTVTPKAGKVNVQREDFTLRTDKDGERTQPMAPSQIAGRTDLTLREVRTGTGTVGTQPTGPVWGGLPLPGSGQSVGNGAGGGGSTKSGVVNTKAAGKVDPMLDTLKQKMLPEKESDQPVTGLLVFNLEKQKLKDLELIYTTPDGPLKLRFR